MNIPCVLPRESDSAQITDAIAFRDLTYSFQRLTNLDNGAFDRLGRYEASLWRQVCRFFHTSATKAPLNSAASTRGIDAALHTWCAATSSN